MDDDFQLKSQQDDLDTSGTDPFADHAGDNPAKELGIPEARLREELNRYDEEGVSDDQRGEEDDMREETERLTAGENDQDQQ